MNQKPAKNPTKKDSLLTLTAEELAKVEKLKASTEGAYPVDNEWMLLAEFAKAYGWKAYQDARQDSLTMGEMLTLIEASRKLEALKQYEMASAVLMGSGAAQSKNPSQTFKSITKDILKRIKVLE